MVVIRLARTGSKHSPKYRITVADSKKFVKKKFIEVLGYYVPAPQGKKPTVVLDQAKAQDWISKGAQPTDRVRHVMKLAQSGEALNPQAARA